MSENKTQPNNKSVSAFIDSIDNDTRREDARAVLKLMKRITRKHPTMWGIGLIGFGTYHYKYASGREGDFFMTGFSPRKQNLVLYIMPGFDRYQALMKKLGKHKTGISCLYINRLSDIDMTVLEQLVRESFKRMVKLHT